jgi:hypothetical protein
MNRSTRWAIAGVFALAHTVSAQAVWQDPPLSATPAGSNGWIATIPFAEDGDPLMAFTVRVNDGTPQWWILDGGSSFCLIDRGAARRAGLAAKGHRAMHAAGTGEVGVDSIQQRLRLTFTGGWTLSCAHPVSTDLSGIEAEVGRPIAGIVGYDLLARYIVQIDFAAHAIRLYDPAVYRNAGRGDTVPLEMVGKLAHVTVRIADSDRPAAMRSLIVDTGSGDGVDDSLVVESKTPPRYSVATTGLGQSHTAIEGTLDTVQIGRFTIRRVPSTGPAVGLIGNAVWSQFTCVFDYPHQRLFLEPNEHYNTVFDRGPRSGLSFLAESARPRPTVASVIPGSPGEVAGIHPGDVIYELDGQPIGDFGLRRLTSLLKRSGNVYRLGVVRSAERRQVVLRL